MDTMRVLPIIGVTAVVLAGCTQPQSHARIGIVAQPHGELRVGDFAPDFSFHDREGKLVSLADVRGEVTVLVIAELEDTDACVTARAIIGLVEEYSSDDVSVKYVCVSETADGSPDLKSNIVERCGLESDRVIGLCDSASWVKALYQAKETGVYFVIGHDDRIAGMGTLADAPGLERTLRKSVSERRMLLAAGPRDD